MQSCAAAHGYSKLQRKVIEIVIETKLGKISNKKGRLILNMDDPLLLLTPKL